MNQIFVLVRRWFQEIMRRKNTHIQEIDIPYPHHKHACRIYLLCLSPPFHWCRAQFVKSVTNTYPSSTMTKAAAVSTCWCLKSFDRQRKVDVLLALTVPVTCCSSFSRSCWVVPVVRLGSGSEAYSSSLQYRANTTCLACRDSLLTHMAKIIHLSLPNA